MFDLDALAELNDRLEEATSEATQALTLADEVRTMGVAARDRAQTAGNRAARAVAVATGCPHLKSLRNG